MEKLVRVFRKRTGFCLLCEQAVERCVIKETATVFRRFREEATEFGAVRIIRLPVQNTWREFVDGGVEIRCVHRDWWASALVMQANND